MEGRLSNSGDRNLVGLHRWDGTCGRPTAFYIDKQPAVYENIAAWMLARGQTQIGAKCRRCWV